MKQTLSVLATALAASVSAGTAQASASDGVSCPTGADASVSNGVLKCSVTLEFVRLSMCPRVDYPNYTQIELRGVDQCLPQVAPLQGRTAVDSAMTPLSAEPRIPRSNITVTDPRFVSTFGVIVPIPPADSAYRRRTDPNGQDRFIASRVVYIWPRGVPMPSTVGHDPKNGVACPSGYDASVLDNRGLRCSDTVARKAGCDSVNPLNPLSPWQIDHRNGRDLCLSKDIAGNRVTGQYTIPVNANYVGAMGNPAQHGWTLAIDRSGEVDHWVKNGTLYKYPVAR